ncbi:MAG: ubiquinone/menaquinone biosynthesis methyltransferase [Deltaproteobacteria bacterium]|nr:ubiquinone/menaquinone biosynthesis methyltransferase [Deltaproteobacteria bacterium]
MAVNLPAAADKAVVVEAMFDRIAPHYDRMNRLLTLGMDQRWRRRTLELVDLRAGQLVLDLACGTGDFAELCRARGARVVALDYAARMLDHAKARGLGGTLARADALRLPLRGASIDVIVCGFALRNFTSLPEAFAEMARVLKPGGRVGLLEVARPSQPLVRLGHSIYFDRVVPLVGRFLADPRAYSYLPASTAYLPPWDELRPMLESVGLADVAREQAMLGAVQILTGRRENR